MTVTILTPKSEGSDGDENWVSAFEARELLVPHFGNRLNAQLAICKRAHSGMVQARAQLLVINDKPRGAQNLVRQFWWAEGQAALQQDWTAGDFDTWIEQTHHYVAHGVSFRRSEIEQMLPSGPAARGSTTSTKPGTHAPSSAPSKNVFIVHGHDESAKNEVARFIQQADLHPIILHQVANAGRTLIEKFESHGGTAGFAIILLTPDDVGGPAAARTDSTKLNPRARQNVIREMFWFAAKLGRQQVCALRKDNIEIPTDFSGVVYVDMDPAGGWRTALLRELEQAGYSIDWRKALG